MSPVDRKNRNSSPWSLHPHWGARPCKMLTAKGWKHWKAELLMTTTTFTFAADNKTVSILKTPYNGKTNSLMAKILFFFTLFILVGCCRVWFQGIFNVFLFKIVFRFLVDYSGENAENRQWLDLWFLVGIILHFPPHSFSHKHWTLNIEQSILQDIRYIAHKEEFYEATAHQPIVPTRHQWTWWPTHWRKNVRLYSPAVLDWFQCCNICKVS